MQSCAFEGTESFEGFISRFETDDLFMESRISDDFYIEEFEKQGDGSPINKRQIKGAPSAYTYDGRIYPSSNQQKKLDISLYLRIKIANDIRVMTLKSPYDEDIAHYWFYCVDGVWILESKVIGNR